MFYFYVNLSFLEDSLVQGGKSGVLIFGFLSPSCPYWSVRQYCNPLSTRLGRWFATLSRRSGVQHVKTSPAGTRRGSLFIHINSIQYFNILTYCYLIKSLGHFMPVVLTKEGTLCQWYTHVLSNLT